MASFRFTRERRKLSCWRSVTLQPCIIAIVHTLLVLNTTAARSGGDIVLPDVSSSAAGMMKSVISELKSRTSKLTHKPVTHEHPTSRSIAVAQGKHMRSTKNIPDTNSLSAQHNDEHPSTPRSKTLIASSATPDMTAVLTDLKHVKSVEHKEPMSKAPSVQDGSQPGQDIDTQRQRLMNAVLSSSKGKESIDGDATLSEQMPSSRGTCCNYWAMSEHEESLKRTLDEETAQARTEWVNKKPECADVDFAKCPNQEACCNFFAETGSKDFLRTDAAKLKFVYEKKGCWQTLSVFEGCSNQESRQALGGTNANVLGQDLAWSETTDATHWKSAKTEVKKMSNEVFALNQEEESAILEITKESDGAIETAIGGVVEQGFLDRNVDVLELASKWAAVISPKQFTNLFSKGADGTYPVPLRLVGEIVKTPDVFSSRVSSLEKVFVMLHKPASQFWEDRDEQGLRWPVGLAGDRLGPMLDDISTTWSANCGQCEITTSCKVVSDSTNVGQQPLPATSSCVEREAVSYDPSVGPLDDMTWAQLHRDWLCLQNPDLLVSRLRSKCRLNASSEVGVSNANMKKYEEWLRTATFENACKKCYNVGDIGWFAKMNPDEQGRTLKQIVGRGQLDDDLVPGPLNADQRSEAKEQLGRLTKEHGLQAEMYLNQWLESAFDGAFKDHKDEVINQVVEVRARKFSQWPTCPEGTLDCLGTKFGGFLERLGKDGDISQQRTDASIRWTSSDAARQAVTLMEPVVQVTPGVERKQLKDKIDAIETAERKLELKLERLRTIVYTGSS